MVFAVFVHEPELAKHALEKAGEREDSLVNWLECAHADGAMNVPDPAAAAELFWGMATGTLFWPQIMFGPMSKKERARVTKEVVDTFLCRFRA